MAYRESGKQTENLSEFLIRSTRLAMLLNSKRMDTLANTAPTAWPEFGHPLALIAAMIAATACPLLEHLLKWFAHEGMCSAPEPAMPVRVAVAPRPGQWSGPALHPASSAGKRGKTLGAGRTS